MATLASDLEHVVLLDGRGQAAGTTAKSLAHSATTALHQAFSCHLVGPDGRVLLTRRALTKRTWPGTWTNGCCGHPQLGETLRHAVERRVRDELGLRITRASVALPDFAYRAEMADGVVEHELCPVVIAEVRGRPTPDPNEVDDLVWLPWPALLDRVEHAPSSMSPWAVEQVRELADLAIDPTVWLEAPAAQLAGPLLDRPIGGRSPRRTVPVHPAGATTVVNEPLESLLERFLAERSSVTGAADPELRDVTAEIRSLVTAGGKRLRPAFVYWGHRATGADHDDAVFHPAAAVELLHTFALLHDDVMDRSANRRGRPTAHRALAAAHERGRRLGEPGWFGYSAAILAGDLTFVWADELLDGTPLPAATVARARAVFSELRREVIAGQYLDLVLASDAAADEKGAHRVALLKSARYTVTRPLLLGAAMAPPHDGARVAEPLTTYGDAIGLAFQMRDDILGLFGDPTETGKSALDDLREGKRTLLILRALRLADPRQRVFLRSCLGDPDLDDGQAAEARRLVAATGALASVEALIDAHLTVALGAITNLPDGAREALVELAELAVHRRA